MTERSGDQRDDGAVTRGSIEAVLRRTATIDRSELARLLMSDRTVYQRDPAGSEAIERIEPNGRRTLGRFVNRRFVELEQTPARRR